MIPHRGGLPHSDIHGSTPARGSPWLFAACHVLHRLLVPRHPPNALLMLTQPTTPHRAAGHNPPCTGTIHTQNTGMNTPYPTTSLATHTSNAPERCRKPGLSTHPVPSQEPNKPLGQTRRTQPATDSTNHPRTPRFRTGPEATEPSCASRDAPEPDSQFQKSRHP